MSDSLSDLLTVEETANHLRVSSNTVFGLIKSGKLPASRVGKQFRISKDTLQNFLQKTSQTEGENNE
jgi:excisionase family DNA binding protein